MMFDINSLLDSVQQGDALTSIVYSFLLIVAAEMGDKSRLVCMTLSTRYRAWPVFFGAALAFIVLNGVAVTLGATVGLLLPLWLTSLVAATIFIGFGLHTLLTSEDEAPTKVKAYGSVITSTFLLITLAEFGDKTQLAVIALASINHPAAIWLGATLGLLVTSALGCWLGKALMTRVPIKRLHQFSGGLLILFGLMAVYQAITLLS